MSNLHFTRGIIHAADDLVRNDLVDSARVVLNCAGINIREVGDLCAFTPIQTDLDRRTVKLIKSLARRPSKQPTKKDTPHEKQSQQ